MKVEIQPDLAAAIADVVRLNGDLTTQGYVNDLIERGLRQSLAEDHNESSVRAFVHELRRTHKADWGLLVATPTRADRAEVASRT